MNYQTFKVHFMLKLNKISQKDFAPIFARITDCVKIEITTNRNLEPVHWANTTESAFSTTKANRELNQYLETFKSKIYEAYASSLSTEEGFSSSTLKQHLYPEPNKKKHLLIETALQHNENFEKLIGIKYSKVSFKNYKTTIKYLLEFVPLQYNQKDIFLHQVNYAFCEAFYLYLINNKACHNNGACKQLQCIQKFVNYAIRAGYITKQSHGLTV